MHTATQPHPETHQDEKQDQFLIVPIFFQKQIHAIVEARSPEHTFGFFYGEEKDNFRIIKKIWPLQQIKRSGDHIILTKRDFENARDMVVGTSMKLLGCFYTSANGKINKAILSDSDLTSFSFVEVADNAWTSSLYGLGNYVEQRVIL